ncbi:spherulin-1B precursor [Phlyctema vagabunda]|uniref:Spherulin-1B n=1 Tax=Phlyctema vagabunda TaxID=108571 RepID=A0ABR4P3M7_9HELO
MHSSLFFLISTLTGLALSAPTLELSKKRDAISERESLISQLQLAPTAVERSKLLPDNKYWLFDFRNPSGPGAITQGEGGFTAKADRETFPALIGTGVGMTVGFFGPCGFNTPHTHPRSSEINICVKGNLVAEFIAENGARSIINDVSEYQMTVFPQGALHTEFNPDCTDSIFVAGFASEDPGVQQAAQTFFGLRDDIVKAALGAESIDGRDIDQFKSTIPPNVARGVESCLQRCGIQKR